MTNLMTFWPSNDMITDHTLCDMIDDHHDFLEPYRPANMALLKFEAAPVRLFSQAPRPSDVANHCPTTQAHPNCATENEACEINTTVPLYRPCCDPCTCNNNTLTCVWDIGGQWGQLVIRNRMVWEWKPSNCSCSMNILIGNALV